MAGARYVAMGSSFGAGPGLRPGVEGSPRTAGRSAVNYAHLVADARSLDLVDVTFSGATIAQLSIDGALGQPAQVAAVGPTTELVTITAGGNDVGYIGGLWSASLPRVIRGLPRINRQLRTALDPADLDAKFAALDADYRALVTDIASRAPDARILIVGYLTILPPAGGAETGLPTRAANWARSVAGRLAELMAAVAESTPAEFVDAAAVSHDHHAWSADPWTNHLRLSLRDGAPFHPTHAGMRAVAALVEARLDA